MRTIGLPRAGRPAPVVSPLRDREAALDPHLRPAAPAFPRAAVRPRRIRVERRWTP
ncbi:hypothetical protein [Amycolatopsis sp. FDAARGOS 1241]|uniref:hypothetical protein n=1 Tax=Amycolatopsis sp. FDAARGOS 1241 TaxID=2778070 RepID=UPI00194FA55C|nr:hypothetical protein [Amycolatopsis sp. FDAARGOS 1241]QRP50152.1 hypothetical protein I6J71_22085 [Amycolatopsis sp. FDAARGOS 1241]